MSVGVWGLFCAARRMRGCCGWFRCGEGAFIVGDGFRFGSFVLWFVVGGFVVCGWWVLWFVGDGFCGLWGMGFVVLGGVGYSVGISFVFDGDVL